MDPIKLVMFVVKELDFFIFIFWGFSLKMIDKALVLKSIILDDKEGNPYTTPYNCM